MSHSPLSSQNWAHSAHDSPVEGVSRCPLIVVKPLTLLQTTMGSCRWVLPLHLSLLLLPVLTLDLLQDFHKPSESSVLPGELLWSLNRYLDDLLEENLVGQCVLEGHFSIRLTLSG